MIYYCSNCWNEIPQGNSFCKNCGADLKKLENENFVQKLIRALNHPEPETPIRAAYILAQIKAKEAVPILLKKLKGEQDPYIIKAFVEALIEIDPAAAKSELTKILSDNFPVTIKSQLEKLKEKLYD